MARAILRSYQSFDGLSVGEGAVWVAGDAFGRTVWKVDPATAKVVATLPLPFIPMAIAAGAGGVWVTSLLDDMVSRIDPATNRITETIPGPRGAYCDRGRTTAGVWVIGSLDRTVIHINPKTNRIAAKVVLDGRPIDVAADGREIWVIEDTP